MINGISLPGWDFCVGISRALGVAPGEVFRRAGLLPSLPPAVAEEHELLGIIRDQPPAVRKTLLSMLRGLAARRQPAAIDERPTSPLWPDLDQAHESIIADIGRELAQVPDEWLPEVLRRLVAEIGKDAGITRVYPHRLRHTFAILYLKQRGDPYSLQYLLGHEDMGVTREYVKIAKQDVSELYRSPLDSISAAIS